MYVCLLYTSYNEFDYAKQAIHIGVTDYLLKPITASKLLEAVKKVAEVIEREREEENMLERYRLEMAENTVLDRQRLFKDLVTSRIGFKEALELSLIHIWCPWWMHMMPLHPTVYIRMPSPISRQPI